MSSVNVVSYEVRTLEDLQTRQTDNKLGQDAFMQILVAQLAHQNPLEPQSDTDFIAQLAQFSALEQMQSLNTGFMTSQAYSLIGKSVYIEKPAEGAMPAELVLGRVDGVIRQSGIDYLLVDGEQYEMSQISGVLDDAVIGSMEDQILKSAALIGKTVTATVSDESGESITVSGIVERIMVNEGEVFVEVDGQHVPILAIDEIAA